MGTLSTYQKKGTDRPGVIFAYGPGTIANVAGAQLAYQDVTNATTFIGTAQDGSTVIKGYNVASPDWFLEEWGTLPDVSNAQTVLERSTGNTTESY